MERRNFLLAGAATAATIATSAIADDDSQRSTTPVTAPASTQVKARVIVIGGGMAGATVAKYLRLWGDAVEVTLIERMPTYTSNIMSSLVLTGQRAMSSLSFKYDALRNKYGITVVFGEVVAVDPVTAKVTLADRTVLTADRIVMAPGIEFDTVPGLGTSDKMPHAWKAGTQTTLLASQLKAMPAGKNMVLTIPLAPYRCPPGPYERACLIADWLKVNKRGSKLIVLDANQDFVTEKDNFTSAFLGLHGSVIEYYNNAGVQSVDPANMTLYAAGGLTVTGAVVNMIPRQRAGGLISATGLNNATKLAGDTAFRFAGVDVLSYASTVAGAGKVHHWRLQRNDTAQSGSHCQSGSQGLRRCHQPNSGWRQPRPGSSDQFGLFFYHHVDPGVLAACPVPVRHGVALDAVGGRCNGRLCWMESGVVQGHGEVVRCTDGRQLRLTPGR